MQERPRFLLQQKPKLGRLQKRTDSWLAGEDSDIRRPKTITPTKGTGNFPREESLRVFCPDACSTHVESGKLVCLQLLT